MVSILANKKRLIILIVSVCLAVTIAAVSILIAFLPQKSIPTWEFPPFTDTLGKQETKFASQDSKIRFDGVLDDEAWKGKRWLNLSHNSDENIRAKMTTHFGTDGLYIAFDVDDVGVFFSKSRAAAVNSGIQLYLSSMYGAEDITDHAYEIMFTAGGTIQVNKYLDGRYVLSAGNVHLALQLKGELNTVSCKGYTMEVYIDYKMLDDDHQSVYSSIAIVRSQSVEGTERQWHWFGEDTKNLQWTRASTWWAFDKDGLIAHNVTLEGDENGSLNGNDYVTDGDDYVFWLEPNEGYYADVVTVNGKPLNEEPLYKKGKSYYILYENNGDLHIKATFKKLPEKKINVKGKVTDGKIAVNGASVWAVKNGYSEPVSLNSDGSFTASLPAISGLKIYVEANGYTPKLVSVPPGGGSVSIVLQQSFIGDNSYVNQVSTQVPYWDLSRLYENKVALKSSTLGSARLMNSQIYSNSVYASANIVVPQKKGVDSRAGFTFFDNAGNRAFIALTMAGEVNQWNPDGKISYNVQVISGDYSWSYDGSIMAFDDQDKVIRKASSDSGIPFAVHYRNGQFDIWVDGVQVGYSVVSKDKNGKAVFASGAKVAVGLESWLCAVKYHDLSFKENYPIPKSIPKIVNGWDISQLDKGIAKCMVPSWLNKYMLTEDYSDKICISANLTLPQKQGMDTRAGFYFTNKRGDNVFVCLTMNGEVSQWNPNGDMHYSLQFISKNGTSWNSKGTIQNISGWNDVTKLANSSSGVPVTVYVENGVFTVGINGYLVADKVFPIDENEKNIFEGDTELKYGLEIAMEKVTYTNIRVTKEKPELQYRINESWDLSKLSEGKVSLRNAIDSSAMLWTKYRSRIYLSANVTLVPFVMDVRTGFRLVDEKGNIAFIALLNEPKETEDRYKLQVNVKPAGGSWQCPVIIDVNSITGIREAATSPEGVPFEVEFNSGKLSVWINGKNVLSNYTINTSDGILFSDDAKVMAGLECWSYAGKFNNIVAYDKRH
ncbi:MAG: hypothetical protein GX957_10155 [Clostridiaceae bacterium]|nr:hypothetical protein [Clostridiaceae bacterium]